MLSSKLTGKAEWLVAVSRWLVDKPDVRACLFDSQRSLQGLFRIGYPPSFSPDRTGYSSTMSTDDFQSTDTVREVVSTKRESAHIDRTGPGGTADTEGCRTLVGTVQRINDIKSHTDSDEGPI